MLGTENLTMEQLMMKNCLGKKTILILIACSICSYVFLISNMQSLQDVNGNKQIRLRNYDNKYTHITPVPTSSSDKDVVNAQQDVNLDIKKSSNLSLVERNHITAFVLSRIPFSSSKPFLTLYPSRGRLGNQMFQTASLVGIALKYDYTPLLPAIGFDIGSVIDLTRLEQTTVDITKHKQFQEGDLSQYDRDITKFIQPKELSVHMNRSLDGYFQSYKHFNHSESVIRRLFTFKKDIKQETRQFMENNVNPRTVTVGIHVRRGDFLSAYHFGLGRVTVDSDYIQRAMDIYRSKYTNITFIVFSNDMNWCKENVRDTRNKIVFSPFLNPGHDLAVMSQCDHMIISVGTFGWWGAWLSGGSVVYFTGYPRAGSEIDKYFVKSDYYPPQWVGIS